MKCSRGENCLNPLKSIEGDLPISEFYKDTNSATGFRYWCKFCANSKAKVYYKNNRESALVYQSRYKKAHKPSLTPEQKQKRNKHSREYIKNRCLVDLNFKIRTRLRNKLSEELCKSRSEKYKATFSLLGMSLEEFKNYISAKFEPGMSWSNWGKYTWHLDHIKPLASFDLTDPVQQEKAFYFTNFQPLKAKDNLSKQDKLDWAPTPPTSKNI